MIFFKTHKKYLKKLAIVIFFTISAIIWFVNWHHGKYYVSTDDAYINADIVQVAPRVTGKVTTLYVKNNQYVHQGDILFTIDEEPFQLAIESAKAQILISEAQLAKATTANQRTSKLLKNKYLSLQDGDNAIANFKTAKGQLSYANTALAQAKLNLTYTKITAPTSGWVSNVTLHEGDIVLANQALFALISDGEFWVDANFKETEVGVIKPGQPATIVSDLYPNHKFNGTVESISGGAGTVFSLLPPQNATGNWVKVTQRIPVRIHITNPDPNHQLRIGSSATTTVRIKS